MQSKPRLGVAGLLIALSATVPAAPARADFRSITISDNEFNPTPLSVRLGDTVVWRHEGQRPHSVKSDTNEFDSSPGCSFQNTGPCMKPGQTFSFTFDQPGTYFYYCNVHGSPNGVGMAGSITVPSGGGGGGTTTTARANTTTTRPPASTTTAKPGATTTVRPGVTTTAAINGTTAPGPTTQVTPGPLPTVATIPGDTTPPPTTASSTSSTALVAAPLDDDDGGVPTPLILVLLVLLAAGLAAAAWYYLPRRG
ncbi:MAG TPA: plastocyanin/azurin family copper-binding protein [Acidimicrobiales bacterium]|nr:plastocyanin/azurin family copper-binding protein [Acidimicrobiales bacterium]